MVTTNIGQNATTFELVSRGKVTKMPIFQEPESGNESKTLRIGFDAQEEGACQDDVNPRQEHIGGSIHRNQVIIERLGFDISLLPKDHPIKPYTIELTYDILKRIFSDNTVIDAISEATILARPNILLRFLQEIYVMHRLGQIDGNVEDNSGSRTGRLNIPSILGTKLVQSSINTNVRFPTLEIEYVSGTPLKKLKIAANNESGALSHEDILKDFSTAFLELSNTLYVLHTHGVFHRDISLSNLIYSEENNRVILIDFGFARFVGDWTAKEIYGTWEIVPPEQALGLDDENAHLADQFSLMKCFTYSLFNSDPDTIKAIFYRPSSMDGIRSYFAKALAGKFEDSFSELNYEKFSEHIFAKFGTDENMLSKAQAMQIALVVYKALQLEPNNRYANVQIPFQKIFEILNGTDIDLSEEQTLLNKKPVEQTSNNY